MSKTYALKRLLEHGPMTPGEIKTCTRWPEKQTAKTLENLVIRGDVRRVRRLDGQRFGYAYEAVR